MLQKRRHLQSIKDHQQLELHTDQTKYTQRS